MNPWAPTLLALLALPGLDEPPARAPAAADARRARSEAFRDLIVAYYRDEADGGKQGRGHFAPRFMELADGDPEDLFGYESLFFLVTGDDPDHPYFRRSMDLLLRHHVQGSQAAQLCRWFVSPAYFGAASGPVVRYLRAVAEENANPDVRAEATFNLALFLRNKAELSEQVSRLEGAGLARKVEGIWGRTYLEALRASDPPSLAREATRLLERGAAKFPGYRESHALAGGPAPPIVGEDITGDPMKLGQFRGKVVVLSFWGFGCLPCRAMFPRERELVRRLEGRPFALLGVNNDPDRADVRRLMAKERIAWASWWDGGETGSPIAAAWGIRVWPSVFVIDHRGVIRYRDVHGRALDVVVDSLLLEIEGGRP